MSDPAVLVLPDDVYREVNRLKLLSAIQGNIKEQTGENQNMIVCPQSKADGIDSL